MNNPNAFPNSGSGYATNGMTLRDYFAAKAMHGLLPDALRSRQLAEPDEEFIILAELAYKTADFMLAQREKGQKK
jgi:hypothetical protein